MAIVVRHDPSVAGAGGSSMNALAQQRELAQEQLRNQQAQLIAQGLQQNRAAGQQDRALDQRAIEFKSADEARKAGKALAEKELEAELERARISSDRLEMDKQKPQRAVELENLRHK